MRETDVLVMGAGGTGVSAAIAAAQAGARVLVLDKGDAPRGAPGLRVLSQAMVLDAILSPEGEVAGALVVADGEVQPVRCRALVLAAGGVDALFPQPADPLATGDAFALAHRAGARLDGFRATLDEGGPRVEGGVATDREGVTWVSGLYATGDASAARADPGLAGERAARDLPEEPLPFGDYRVVPRIDSDLPKGFTATKLDRLRALMDIAVKTGGTDLLPQLHRLKGEADEFARARVDVELFSFQNACEVALLLASGATTEPR